MDLSELDIWNRVYYFFHRPIMADIVGVGNEPGGKPAETNARQYPPDYLKNEAEELLEGE